MERDRLPALLDLLIRVERAHRSFPEGTVCADCEQRNPVLFVRKRRSVRCYRCDSNHRGRPPFEDHHLGGRPGDRLERTDANLHRLLSFLAELCWRDQVEPGSEEAVVTDLILLRLLGPSFGADAP